MSRAKRIWVCINGPYCCKKNPQDVLAALQKEVADKNLGDKFEVLGGGCLGMCGHGPNCIVMASRARTGYAHLKPENAAEIIEAHKGDIDQPIEKFRLKRPNCGNPGCDAK